jgi:hypothetical protein
MLGKIFIFFLRKYSKDLDLELQLRARKTSADFIKNNFQNIPAFANKFELLQHAIKHSNEKGLYLEFGVYKAETVNFIASFIGDKKVYGFDSFEGLPEYWRPGFEKGFFKTKLPRVKPNVDLIKGWFNITLPEFIKNNNQECSFIHIDSDLYSSAKTIFKYLDKQINKDTVVVFDEFFNYSDWEKGEYKAFREHIKKTGIKFKFLGYCSKDEQVAIKFL